MSEFNQAKYIQKWDKQNMASITVKYKKDFVLEFKEACASLGLTQSEIIRQAMTETIEKAQKKSEE